jgi:phage baseplate assembly protein W
MAYRVEPSDTGIDNPFISGSVLTAVGVSLPFNGNIAFNSTYSTIEQVRSNLIDYILTNKGERPLNPNYGSDLRKYVFSNITDQTAYGNVGLDDLKSILTSGIQNNFAKIRVNSLIITPSSDTNTVNISIDYSFLGTLSSINITI